jgi:RND family efflux transporter MFP subunit
LRQFPSAWLVAVALLKLAACGGPSEYVEAPPPTVTVAQPAQRTVTDYLEMTGTVKAIETVEIRARVEGFLQSVEFEEGDYLQEGDLLYRIDPSEYEARVQEAEASVAVAKASLGLEEATLLRLKKARETRAVSELEVIESQARRDVAAANLAAARASLRDARLDLGYTKIRTPITGRVGRTRVDPGNLVGAGERTLLTNVVRYDPIYAYFDLSERQLLALMNSTDRVRGDSGSPQRIRQVPVELGRANEEGYPMRGNLHYTDQGVDPETGTLLLRAIFPNPQPVLLLPGLFVRGRIPIREREGALLVGDRALGSDQSGSYLLVVGADNVAEYRSVEVGARVDGMRVIEKGLEPDDWVITNGILRARPGAKVNPQREGEQPAPAGAQPAPEDGQSDAAAEPGG